MEMITVCMTEKACERVVFPMNFSKAVNLNQVSVAIVKTLTETNSEFQEILEICEPLCMRHDGIVRTLYYSPECRHPEILAALRSASLLSL